MNVTFLADLEEFVHDHRPHHRGALVRLIGLAVVLTLTLAPLAAEGQAATKAPRVGFIFSGPVAPRMHLWNAFREGLRDLGYVEGQNIVFEFRAPEREGDPVDSLAVEAGPP